MNLTDLQKELLKIFKNNFSAFQTIRDAVNEFKSLKTVDFQAKMINNDKYS